MILRSPNLDRHTPRHDWVGLPGLPAVPADAWQVKVTTKSLPTVSREQQGYLTLAQFQESFG